MGTGMLLHAVDLNMVSDVLMLAGTIGATAYCMVLARRLRSFSTLETGMGGAIAVLSAQVDDMTKALERARGAASGSSASLETLTLRAEGIASRLELLVAAMHDLPDAPKPDPEKPVDVKDERRFRVVRHRSSRAVLEAVE